jgi:hypothetical protein
MGNLSKENPMEKFRKIGKVKRIYPDDAGTYIELDIRDPDRPKDGYFRLEQSHSNYNALYSLALVAAVNRYSLEIRTVTDVSPTEVAVVQYMRVDW